MTVTRSLSVSCSPYTRMMTLKDCTFVYALPTSENRFRRSESLGEFAHFFSKGWAEYSPALLTKFERLFVPLETLGLTVVRYPRAAAFARLLHGTRAVVLFAHCNCVNQTIEFSDGMIHIGSIVQAVSPDFAGVADLSACDSDEFGMHLKQQAPHSAIGMSPVRLSSRFWLLYYATLFRLFADKTTTYAEALEYATATCRRTK